MVGGFLMKIALCQFAPIHGNVQSNMDKASGLLQGYTDKDAIDLLILPEMAFSGYVFKSKEDILPFIEDFENGVCIQWCQKQGLTCT